MTKLIPSIGSNPSRSLRLLCAVAWAGWAAAAHGQEIVYDNLNTPLGFYAGGFPYEEIADDVFLDGSARTFQSLSVAYTYFVSDLPENTVTDAKMTVSIYDMDGPTKASNFNVQAPGSLLFQQTVCLVNSPSWLVTLTDNSGITLPDHVAVGLSFTGINYSGGDGDGGPLLLDPPVVGGSYNDFWIKFNDQNGWELHNMADSEGNAIPANFGLQIVATPDGGTWVNLLSLPLLLAAHRVSRRFSWHQA